MNMFEKITSEEKELIFNIIKENASYSIEKSVSINADFETIFSYWNKAKSEGLFEVFADKLIYEKPISYTLSPQEIQVIINKEHLYSLDFYRQYLNYINNIYTEKKITYIEYNHLYNMIGDYNLAINIYPYENHKIIIEGCTITLNTGSKISKILGKIANAANLTGYEEFRIKHSQCLNQKKLSGKLCISIHPLDYITMSDNLYNWSSCMSWERKGDYRAGTVEMMNSPNVVVAYLKSDHQYSHEGDRWYDKKWRQLFIVDPRIIMAVKPYPYKNDDLQGIALQWLKELAMKNAGWGPYTNAVNIVDREELTIAEINKKFKFCFETEYMYNDIEANGDEHLGYVSCELAEGNHYITYSGVASCMSCGNRIYYDDNSCAQLLCAKCEEIYYCYECGEIIDANELYIDPETRDHLCENCYNSMFTTCELCEDEYRTEEIREVYIYHNNEITGVYRQFCENCINTKEFEKVFGPIRKLQDARFAWWHEYKWAINTEYITDEGYEILNINEAKANEYRKARINASEEEN